MNRAALGENPRRKRPSASTNRHFLHEGREQLQQPVTCERCCTDADPARALGTAGPPRYSPFEFMFERRSSSAGESSQTLL